MQTKKSKRCQSCDQHLLEFLQAVTQFPTLLFSKSWLLLVSSLLLHNDLVARFIIDLIRTLRIFHGRVVQSSANLCQASCATHLVLGHDPLLGAHLVSEFSVVANNGDTTLKIRKALDQSTQAITVQIIGGFVKDDQVRVLPARRTNHPMDLPC